MTRMWLAVLVVIAFGWSVTATEPSADTRRWWSHVKVLASDEMQGREAGSEGHRKAARYVAQQFRRAGLVPAGEAEYYQPVLMRAIRFNPERSSAALIRANGDLRMLRWQRQIGNLPREGAPMQIDAPLGFTGWERPSEADARGRFVAHPTVPKAQLVANINLDALRPIFPLTSLTTLGLDDSTLGDLARERRHGDSHQGGHGAGSHPGATLRPMELHPGANPGHRIRLWVRTRFEGGGGLPPMVFRALSQPV